MYYRKRAVSYKVKNTPEIKGDVLNGIKLNRIQKSCLEFKAAFLMLLICYIVFFKVIQDLNPNPVYRFAIDVIMKMIYTQHI